MSSLAYPRRASRARRRDPVALCAGWGADLLLAVAVGLLGAVLLAQVAGDVNVDSWLAVVDGRFIWSHGIPARDSMAVMTAGRPWLDQQWLAQLADEGLVRVGGFGLLALINVVLLVGPVGAAVLAARRLGAPTRSALILLPLTLALITPSREIRTQELAFPLFVAVVWLLASDSRRPSRRVLWCLPLLALWANLHGSATLGAGLVALRGLELAWQRRATWASPRSWARPLALLVGPPLALLATPYGTGIITYYRSTMANPALRHAVTEWRPVTSAPITAAATGLILLVGIASVVRAPGRSTPWEKLGLLVLIAATVSVVRNAVFLGLFALLVLPVALGWGPAGGAEPDAAPRSDRAQPSQRSRGMINAGLALATLLALTLTAVATLARPTGPLIDAGQQPGVLSAVQRATAADASLRVLADGHFSDWLLWRDPALSGRLADDVRFELLSAGQIHRLLDVFDARPGWRRAARGYRLLVLRRAGDAPAIRALLHEPGHRVLFDGSGQLVILRSASAAARS